MMWIMPSKLEIAAFVTILYNTGPVCKCRFIYILKILDSQDMLGWVSGLLMLFQPREWAHREPYWL